MIHAAAWIVPIAGPPIRNGWVAVEGGRVAAVGGPGDSQPGRDGSPLPSEAILPGLVNAHTHLELSYLRGRVPPADRFGDWVRALVALRRQSGDAEAPVIAEAARQAIAEARAAGTALVGDISNTLVTVGLLRAARMPAHVFHELLGLNAPDPEGLVRRARARVDALPGDPSVRVGLTPHAPYSVSGSLFGAIRRDLEADATVPFSVHVGESCDEVAHLAHGRGGLRAALEAFGAWDGSWTPPGCGPVEYLARLGLVDHRLVAVHGVHLTDAELARLARAGATLVTCPRSNRWTGGGAPPIDRFYASGVRVAIGTDSLASVGDMNLFEELAAVRRLAPGIRAAAILESATRAGAEALGFGDRFGTIEPGREARLIAVRTPAGLEDVEEYLVGGITPADVRWLSAGEP